MLVRGGTELGYLIVKCIHLLGILLYPHYQVHILLVPLSDPGGLSLDGIPQPAKHFVPGINGEYEVTDGAHFGLGSIVVVHVHVAECDNLLMRLA